MSKAMHTPGPWCVEDPMGPELLSVIARGDRPVYEWRHVAQVSVQPEPDEADDIPAREAEANARLIAAAPDLLAALKDMLDWAGTPSNQASPSWITGACQRARAAIAKATGGEA